MSQCLTIAGNEADESLVESFQQALLSEPPNFNFIKSPLFLANGNINYVGCKKNVLRLFGHMDAESGCGVYAIPMKNDCTFPSEYVLSRLLHASSLTNETRIRGKKLNQIAVAFLVRTKKMLSQHYISKLQTFILKVLWFRCKSKYLAEISSQD